MDLKELFGDGRLSFEELMVKLTDAGVQYGDLAAVRAEYDGKITGACHKLVLPPVLLLHAKRCGTRRQRN